MPTTKIHSPGLFGTWMTNALVASIAFLNALTMCPNIILPKASFGNATCAAVVWRHAKRPPASRDVQTRRSASQLWNRRTSLHKSAYLQGHGARVSPPAASLEEPASTKHPSGMGDCVLLRVGTPALRGSLSLPLHLIRKSPSRRL